MLTNETRKQVRELHERLYESMNKDTPTSSPCLQCKNGCFYTGTACLCECHRYTPQRNGFGEMTPDAVFDWLEESELQKIKDTQGHAPDIIKGNKDTPQSNTDWLEEFDKQFGSTHADRPMPSGLETADNIKSFISQLLEAEKKRWREDTEKRVNRLLIETAMIDENDYPVENDDAWSDGAAYMHSTISEALDAVLQKLS